jgi:hypothetical protein
MGTGRHMEAVVAVREVKAVPTRSGNTRYVLVDEDGKEYTTFRPEIGNRAQEAEGKRARIEYHEAERNGFQNVYLDAVQPLDDAATDGDDDQADEVAWRTAIEAAPWLLGDPEPKEALPADDLFEKLKSFKDLVEDDITDGEPEAHEPRPRQP